MSPYSPPLFLFNRHLETIYPSLLRKVNFHQPERERITTPDDDFLDVDRYRQGSRKCVVISHGLEGNSSRAYVTGMARAFFTNDYDVVAWNFRGCSGTMNRQLRFYHSGATDDLHTLVQYLANQYEEIILVGFSLGGNLTLKYVGEPWTHVNVSKAITFSVPLNLHTSCMEICRPGNWIYHERFLRSLKKKVKEKAAVRKDLDIRGIDAIKSLFEFDNVFTGPIHGFKDAIDYYTQCSSLYFIQSVRIPTLVVNAVNDPFLSTDCYPDEKSRRGSNIQFEFPSRGGHVGFSTFGQNGLYWSEMRALTFASE